MGLDGPDLLWQCTPHIGIWVRGGEGSGGLLSALGLGPPRVSLQRWPHSCNGGLGPAAGDLNIWLVNWCQVNDATAIIVYIYLINFSW